MNNHSSQNFQLSSDTDSSNNYLWQYLQSLDPQTVASLSQPPVEVAQIMQNNIIGMLGGLPNEQFEVTVTTTRESLGQLLTSAILNGYFLHNAQQRMELEKKLTEAN